MNVMSKRRTKTAAEFQVEALNESLKALDNSFPAFPLWTRLVAFLSTLCELVNDLQLAVNGTGNGSRGLLERTVVIEGAVKVMQSDIREMLNTLREVYGIDRDGIAKEFDAKNNPGRRSSDEKSWSDKILEYVLENVLPQVIVWIVLGWLAMQIAIHNNLVMTG